MTLTSDIPNWEELIFFIPFLSLFLTVLAGVIALVTNHRRIFAVYLLVVVGVIVLLLLDTFAVIKTMDGGPVVFAVAFLLVGMSFIGPILLSIGLIGLANGATKSIWTLSVSSLALTWFYVISAFGLMFFR